MEQYMTLKELCEEISISTATGRNWMKLGKITPEYTEKKKSYFSQKYVQELKKNIQSGSNEALKSRRNKKYVSGNALYHSYVSETCKSVEVIQELLQILSQNEGMLDERKLQIILADCAVKLLAQKQKLKLRSQETALLDFIDSKISFGDKDSLVHDLILDKKLAKKWIQSSSELFRLSYVYEEQEDILGLLYISCKNIGNRKVTGSYYTSTTVVRKLIKQVVDKNGVNKKVLDPCCGTGNFLLQLPKGFSMDKIYGNDIDVIGMRLTRINMALKFPKVKIETICQHITSDNFLSEYKEQSFDMIIGNPPWGYVFSEEEGVKLRESYTCAVGKNIESYDVFIEQSLNKLKRDGVLSFVLPEAILNVKSHTPIRQMLTEQASIQYLEFLGNAFDKVQCPCIILQMKNTRKKMSCIGMQVNDGNRVFTLKKEREITPVYFSFTMTDQEYQIVQKMVNQDNITFLENQAIFALGIVTGNNKKYISNKKSTKNEVILKGSDLCRFRKKETNNYIVFKPKVLQQVAPTEYYRAPEKLLYRFICNQLVFAYDDEQTLSLNSCNLVIPQIPEIEIKYVLAILNSRMAQFLYKKQFNSVKVLRSHIEQIPIPKISLEEQKRLIKIVDALLVEQSEEKIEQLYEQLDEEVRKLYYLTDAEYMTIKKAVDGENKFLV